MKKKALSALCLAFLMCSVTGCSAVNTGERFKDRINDAVKERSEINSDSDYINYKADLSAGRLTDGHYSYTGFAGVDRSGTDDTAGKAAVSLSQNSMLNVHYYLDEAHKNEITDPYHGFVYLAPGQSLYATTEKKSGSSPEKYSFSSFRVFSIKDGKKTLVSEEYDTKTGLFFTAPDNCDGLEFSAGPVGKYENKELTLSDYYTDDTFAHIDAEGKWTIGNKEFSAGKAEAGPFGLYTVKYEFDADKYFFVSSEPKYSYIDENSVVFGRASASDDISEYSVELHPYISVTMKTPESNVKVEINGESAGSFTKGQDIVLDHLKFGDTIVLNCSKKDVPQYDKTVLSLEKSDDNFAQYTFIVKEQSEDFTFDPADYTFEHGKVTFSYLGNPITGKISLAAGRQIEYAEAEADDGYWLPTGNNVITVSEDPEETEKQLEKIRFYEKKLVTVTLPQPSAGGTVVYKKDDRTLTGKTEKMLAGTEIKLILKPWAGWESAADGDTFIVSDESDEQTVTIGDVNVKNIFKEINEHRPKLKVIADKLVGTDMQFTVRTSDVSENELSRDIKNNVLLDTTTGTADGIYISADNGKIAKSQIVKLHIVKTDSKGDETTEIIYLNELPSEKKIDIYSQNESNTSDVYYTDITITIFIAFRQVYEPRTYENAVLSLQYADTSDRQTISSGDLLDRDRLVTVKFKPAEGYYITGDNVTDNVYTSEMKYSEYLQTAEKIGKNYPRKKIYTVDLVTTDKYGKVTFTLNGKQVSGKTKVREDDKLVMDYVIENKDYIIYKDFLSAMYDLLSKSPYERSETITITEDLDGSSISREDFIEVQKKEK